VLDLAEIPSVQETRAADADADGSVSPAEWDAYKQRKAAEILRQLELSVDNQSVPLELMDAVLSQPLGQGDIHLVRLEAWFKAAETVAPHIYHRATFRDRSDPARIGWRELVVHAGTGATLADSSAPDQDVSDELRVYPDDLLQSPLDRREAHWSFLLDGSSAPVTAPVPGAAVNRPTDPFAALVTAADLNLSVIVLAMVGAAILGGIHAASPGHGKTVMAAYIVGTQGTILHASALALSVTLAHTAGVLVLGVLTVLASNVVVPERLYPWLTLVSGGVVLVVGGRFLLLAVRGRMTGDRQHEHEHEHAHSPSHSHAQGGLAPTWRNLFALGLAGGVVPSGSALVVLLSSVALGRMGFGLVLIVAFGLGMAVVLVTTGVLLVHAGRLMVRLLPDEDESPTRRRLAAAVPLISACIMTLLGGVATFEGLSQIGALGR
jgi:ABC-type nickel/cobalt efflux system permease component RcnA